MTDDCKWQQGESLEAQVIQAENKKTQITRKIQQLTGMQSINNQK